MRHSKAPDGWFHSNFIVFGTLEGGGRVSRGFTITPADIRHSGLKDRGEYYRRIRLLLAQLEVGQSLQIQFTAHADYRFELERYKAATSACNNEEIRRWRNERFIRYWRRMQEWTLRRESLVIFWTRTIEKSSRAIITPDGLERRYRDLIGQLEVECREWEARLRMIMGTETEIRAMTDCEHYEYFWRFLNPAGERLEQDIKPLFNSEDSVSGQCWNCDIKGVDGELLYMDGHYHSLFVLKRWPMETNRGDFLKITGLPFLNMQLTVEINPISVEKEIRREQKDYDRLLADYQDAGRIRDLTSAESKAVKIRQLSRGHTYPFNILYVFRVWHPTLEGVRSMADAVKKAVMDCRGAILYETVNERTVQKIFFATWPGWTGSSYWHRHVYAEDRYLADMLPMSSTFTGFLQNADAIYDGSNGNLVGVSLFDEGGQPQHSVLFGMSGAGKSQFMIDLLFQTAAKVNYTVIIEEGRDYLNFTRAMGDEPITVEPDSDLVINPFDTLKLPLTRTQISMISVLLSRMAGESSDNERQQLRMAQLGQYVNRLYETAWEDWSRKHDDKLLQLQRLVTAIEQYRKEQNQNITSLEAWIAFNDLLKNSDKNAVELLEKITEEQITELVTSPDGPQKLMRYGFSVFEPDDYPTLSMLLEQMLANPLLEHDKQTIGNLVSMLSAWTAAEGRSRLFDGISNVRLHGRVAHFDLSRIPQDDKDLKAAVGMLVSGFARQHIITLPRNIRKQMIFEELARFLDVPGGEKVVAESYAQLRKYGCVTFAIVQQYAQFKNSRVRPIVMGNSSNFFLMRQQDENDLDDICRDIHLSDVTKNMIMNYPKPTSLPEGRRYSSVCLYSPTKHPPVCGTIRHVQSIELTQAVEAK